MTIKIRYRMTYGESPLTAKRGVDAWHLLREVIEDATGRIATSEAVAIFNLDSEAETFMHFLMSTEACATIDLPAENKELYALQKTSHRRGAVR